MSFMRNLKEAIAFQYLKIIEDEPLALEDASHIVSAVDEFVDKKSKKSFEFFDLNIFSERLLLYVWQ